MDNSRNILTSIVLCFILFFFAVEYRKNYNTNEPPTFYGGDASVYVGGQPYYLSGTGLTSSATSIGLTDFSVYKNDGTKYELTTADVAGTSGSVFLTIEPGNSTKQEFVSCTTVTQGSGTSATLSGCSRGLLPFSPYTASSTYAFPHNGGAKVVISNSPAFYNQFAGKSNDESISGTWTFADSPLLTTDCTVASANNEICAKAYIDGIAVAGASNANLTTKGIVEMATQTEAASSTTYGATGAYLSIPANMATDTPNTATRASRVLMSDMTGYIKQGWLNLTEAFTWTGAHIFSALATFNGGMTSTATTTLAGSSLTNNAIVINTLPFSFDSTRSASSTVLMEDGTGKLKFLSLAPSSTFAASPTRVKNTNYQNTTGRPLFVTITANLKSTQANLADISAYIGTSIYSMSKVGGAMITIVEGGFGPYVESDQTISFIVPNNYYYIASSTVVNTATANIGGWTEIQI